MCFESYAGPVFNWTKKRLGILFNLAPCSYFSEGFIPFSFSWLHITPTLILNTEACVLIQFYLFFLHSFWIFIYTRLKIHCFSAYCVLVICVYIQIWGQSAGRNEAELGKVTAPECCCPDPEGLALWPDRCLFTRIQLCVFYVCICLQTTQRENGAKEAQWSGQHTSGPLKGETHRPPHLCVQVSISYLSRPSPQPPATNTPRHSSVSMLTGLFLWLCVSKQPEQVLKHRWLIERMRRKQEEGGRTRVYFCCVGVWECERARMGERKNSEE